MVVDTGSTYTLMRENLWKQMRLADKTLLPAEVQRFVTGDSTGHPALGKERLYSVWHGRQWGVEAHAMEDRHLAFLMIIGCDFLLVWSHP